MRHVRSSLIIGLVALAITSLAVFANSSDGGASTRRAPVPSGEVMFTVKAAGGSLSKDNPTQVPISLTLTGVEATTSWFTAADDSDTVTTAQALAMIGFDTRSPHAVISTAGADEAHDAIAATLWHPVYDAAAGTLQLAVTPLPTADVDGELTRFTKDLDEALPSTFGATSLFIDNRDTLVSKAGTPMVGNWTMTGSVVVPPGSVVTVKRKWDDFNNCVLEDGTQFTDQRQDWAWNDPDGHAYSQVNLSVTAVDGGSCDWERSAMHWAISIKGRAGVADVSVKQPMAGASWYTTCEGTSEQSGIYCVGNRSMYHVPYLY